MLFGKSFSVDKYSRSGKLEIVSDTRYECRMDGDIHVKGKARFVLIGKIIGNLIIDPEAQAEINGVIKGSVICRSTKPLYLNRHADVDGKVFCNSVKLHDKAQYKGDFTMGIYDTTEQVKKTPEIG